MTGDPIIDGLTADLRSDEGVKPSVYQDQFGYWTIGVGRLIDARKGGHLSDDEIDYLLANDIHDAIADVSTWPAWQAVKDDPIRARGFLNMRFQLGHAGLMGFTHSLDAIAAKSWALAAAGLRASAWYSQTPARAERVIQMITTGVTP